jgi:hypothetical protein
MNFYDTAVLFELSNILFLKFEKLNFYQKLKKLF